MCGGLIRTGGHLQGPSPRPRLLYNRGSE